MTDNLRIILIVLAVLVVAGGFLALLFSFTKKGHATADFSAERVGAGEKLAAILRPYARLNNCRVYENFSFTYREKPYAVDCLMVGEFGILLADAVDFKGELYGTENEPTWTHYLGDEKETLENLDLSLRNALAALRATLGQEGIFKTRMIALSVALEKKLEIYVPDKEAPLKVKALKGRLNSSEFLKKGHEDKALLVQALEKIAEK